jgi:predicted Zn-dependent protease
VLDKVARYDEAQEYLHQAIHLAQDNSVALLSLAIVQTHAGHLDAAQATLSSALERFPANFYMHYQLGKILLQEQEANPNDSSVQAKAVKAFEDALRYNPSHPDTYYQLAKLYARASPQRAEEYLTKCLRLDPENAPAKYSLARIYLKSGREKEGQALIELFEKQRHSEQTRDNSKPQS